MWLSSHSKAKSTHATTHDFAPKTKADLKQQQALKAQALTGRS